VRRRTRWLPGLCLAAALVTMAAALLAPGAGNAAASLSSLISPASCRGVTLAVLPAQGFVTNPARTQGGHLWWRRSAAGTCVGTVVEWVRYNTTATKTWKVLVYAGGRPQVVAHRTFTLRRGWYFWDFGVHRAYQGLSAVCVTADDSFGTACTRLP
jgi:hypothetical protein